ncbi:MAG: indole-3-glycerol phosphate synthase TrpC [Acidimicrobiales bacterium]
MATYLDAIVDAHRAAAADDHRSLDHLITEASGRPPARPFGFGLRAAEGLAVIAEIKRRSPSKGSLAGRVDPARRAGDYELGGATALSVLTDEAFFGGSADDLTSARAAVTVPVLRKDFTVSAADVCDARIMGADAVLLIAAVLDDAELADFHALAAQLGLDALVETHDETEVERALAVGATVSGVTQRDLTTFRVDHQRAVRVAKAIPSGVVRVAESGVRSVDDATDLAAAGYDAVLVGETLMTADDPAATVAGFRAVARV